MTSTFPFRETAIKKKKSIKEFAWKYVVPIIP